MLNCLHPVWKNPIILGSSPFFQKLGNTKQLNYGKRTKLYSKRSRIVCGFLPVHPWAPNVDSQSIASQLFAFSLFPYVGFLYFIAKVHYGTSLSNVDWLHGGAESLLTLTNLFIVLGLREAIRKTGNPEESKTNDVSRTKEEKKSSI
ncbi:unnamed protein product [Withania somnifera]